MATLYDTGATSALNEDKYINKLYDSISGKQKETIQQGYDASAKQLDTGKQQVANQTQSYLDRAQVEGQRAQQNYSAGQGGYVPLSGANNAQARLTIGNQNQANATALNQQQAAADMEFERQRKLLADQYAAQIKQAQADNDMNRAQALYDAAKAEEEQLRQFRQSAETLMASKGDNSILNTIAKGTPVTRDTTSETWGSVLRNEDSINKIYDAAIQSQMLQAQMDRDKGLSDLEAKQAEAVRKTDQNLTQTYVDALKKAQNYQEVQNAYGQGSGTADQARLARETGLAADLTNLRKLQLGQDAQTEQQRLALVDAYGQEIAKAQAANDLKRVQELYAAAEREEQALVSDQKVLANQLIKDNNYSVLGKLYGLTPDQVDRLQGTGRYAPVYYGGGGYGSDGGVDPAYAFVYNMVNGLTSSNADPHRVIAGTNALSAAEKGRAEAYYNAALGR